MGLSVGQVLETCYLPTPLTLCWAIVGVERITTRSFPNHHLAPTLVGTSCSLLMSRVTRDLQSHKRPQHTALPPQPVWTTWEPEPEPRRPLRADSRVESTSNTSNINDTNTMDLQAEHGVSRPGTPPKVRSISQPHRYPSLLPVCSIASKRIPLTLEPKLGGGRSDRGLRQQLHGASLHVGVRLQLSCH